MPWTCATAASIVLDVKLDRLSDFIALYYHSDAVQACTYRERFKSPNDVAAAAHLLVFTSAASIRTTSCRIIGQLSSLCHVARVPEQSTLCTTYPLPLMESHAPQRWSDRMKFTFKCTPFWHFHLWLCSVLSLKNMNRNWHKNTKLRRIFRTKGFCRIGVFS